MITLYLNLLAEELTSCSLSSKARISNKIIIDYIFSNMSNFSGNLEKFSFWYGKLFEHS